jgi:hypothetical protein
VSGKSLGAAGRHSDAVAGRRSTWGETLSGVDVTLRGWWSQA